MKTYVGFNKKKLFFEITIPMLQKLKKSAADQPQICGKFAVEKRQCFLLIPLVVFREKPESAADYIFTKYHSY